MPVPTEGFAATGAHVRPMWFRDGAPITVEVQGFESLRDTTVTAVVSQMSAVDVSWVLQVPVRLDEHGSGTYTHSEGLSLGHEASVYVGSLIEGDGPDDRREYVFPDVWFSIANPSESISSVEDVVRAHERIAGEHESTYLTQMGDPSAPGAIEHRVLCVVAGLYLTTEMKLPGMRIVPIDERGAATDEREIINGVLEKMAWPTRLDEEDWQRSAQAQAPLALVLCQSVWAPSYEAAGELARDARDRVIALMAINRRATGQPLCIVIEQRQPDDTVLSKWAPERPPYLGNLVGGFLSGEDQRWLLQQYRSIYADPLLKLSCDLFGEGLRDRSIDAQFLRFWSILEVLSGARLPGNDLVTLRDGTPWPNESANTTKNAVPRVYRYVAGVLDVRQIDESSFVAPAESLYQAVRVWYARRNATGHYGRFIVDDPRQQAQGWYSNALLAADVHQSIGTWIRALQDTVSTCIDFEMATASKGPRELPSA